MALFTLNLIRVFPFPALIALFIEEPLNSVSPFQNIVQTLFSLPSSMNVTVSFQFNLVNIPNARVIVRVLGSQFSLT